MGVDNVLFLPKIFYVCKKNEITRINQHSHGLKATAVLSDLRKAFWPLSERWIEVLIGTSSSVIPHRGNTTYANTQFNIKARTVFAESIVMLCLTEKGPSTEHLLFAQGDASTA